MSDPIKFIPHKYQEREIANMRSKNIYGLGMYPGLGKTVVALDTIYSDKKPTLIIVPLSILYTTWLNEHNKWEFSRNLKISILHGPDKVVNLNKKAGIYLINPEGMKWLLDELHKRGRRAFPWHTLIVDESVAFKNPKSKRFPLLKKLLPHFKRRHILTGNPIPNTMMDLWAQIYILDLGKRLGTSFYKFKNRYFYATDYKRWNWELLPGAEDEIIEKISDVFSVVTINDSGLDLPERVIIDKEIILPSNVRKTYKLMEDKLFTQIDQEGPKIFAPAKGSALMKCNQITQGFVYSYDESHLDPTVPELYEPDKKPIRLTHNVHNLKLEAIHSIVNELNGQPCIILYHFNEDLKRLIKAFPDAPVAGSSTTPDQLQKIEQGWNKNKFPIVLSHLQKLSHGLNLQYGDGHTLILYSLLYNFDTFDQLVYRIQRQGATYNRVIIYRLVAKDTVNEAMVSSLDKKGNMKEDFFNSLIQYRQRH